VGGRRWDSGVVLQETYVVLGRDDVAAWEYVERVRGEINRGWKVSIFGDGGCRGWVVWIRFLL
jgi:hypothetical protein